MIKSHWAPGLLYIILAYSHMTNMYNMTSDVWVVSHENINKIIVINFDINKLICE